MGRGGASGRRATSQPKPTRSDYAKAVAERDRAIAARDEAIVERDYRVKLIRELTGALLQGRELGSRPKAGGVEVRENSARQPSRALASRALALHSRSEALTWPMCSLGFSVRDVCSLRLE
jgi:hypothetical protein